MLVEIDGNGIIIHSKAQDPKVTGGAFSQAPDSLVAAPKSPALKKKKKKKKKKKNLFVAA